MTRRRRGRAVREPRWRRQRAGAHRKADARPDRQRGAVATQLAAGCAGGPRGGRGPGVKALRTAAPSAGPPILLCSQAIQEVVHRPVRRRFVRS